MRVKLTSRTGLPVIVRSENVEYFEQYKEGEAYTWVHTTSGAQFLVQEDMDTVRQLLEPCEPEVC